MSLSSADRLSSPSSVDSHSVEVVTLGETMAVAASTDIEGLALAPTLTLTSAGAEGNVAIGLSRLGHRAAWVGRVGADALGDRVERDLRAECLRTFVTRQEDANTGLIVKQSRGARGIHVWYYRSESAGSYLCPDDVPAEVIMQARLLHVSGVTLALGPAARAAVEKAVSVARAADTLVSFDVNYRSRLWSRERATPVLRGILEQADVLFAGVEEARLFCPTTAAEEDLPAMLGSFGPREVMLKLGDRGAVAWIDGARHVVSPYTGFRVVDPVGAGDAFAAGYLSAKLRGTKVSDRLSMAAYAGACACTTTGDWEGLPYAEELETDEEVRR